MAELTPMMKQYQKIKENHKDAILFFRLGDFYEMFLEDAKIASRELEITLTSRDGGNNTKIPMCGIPYHAADGYLAKLINKGYRVAICEQVEDPKAAKGIVKREVVRIITPGTVLESNILHESKQNYLISIYSQESKYALTYTDISTGEFMTTEITDNNSEQKLLDEIGRISPVECLLPSSLYHDKLFISKLNRVSGACITNVPEETFFYDHAVACIKKHFNVLSIESLGLSSLPLATCSIGAILQFLAETQKKDLFFLKQLRIYSTSAFMLIDHNTRRNLELTSTIRGGKKQGSLLWVCDRTVSALGTRLIKQWIEKPLLDPDTISDRLNAVDELINNIFIREDLRNELKKIYDLERLISRISFGSANPRDLIALKNSLAILPEIDRLLKTLESNLFKKIIKDFNCLEDICHFLNQALVNDPPISSKDGGIIKDGYDKEVDELRSITKHGKSWIADLEAKEKNNTGIRSLKVGYNKVFGYYIEVTNANLASVPIHYIRKQTLANAERFITHELKEWENKILGASEKLASKEYQLFLEIRQQISEVSTIIQKTAAVIAQIDVLLSFAQVSVENGYCKPEINNTDVIHIVDGRHPVVEKITGTIGYVPNDTYLDSKEHQICLLTGPNMAGKSTYMRQVALCVLMAQIGCFVPASSAKIGLVDRIFTRVGAADDLSGGQSTFMVEMVETSNILRNATGSSLIILDEIGRGTSTYDGLSIAWAVIEFLLQPSLGAKTLFATHYHELTQLADKYPQIKNYSVAIKEKEGTIIFLRKIIPGGTDKSYGIQVAKLAGLPDEILCRANEILLTMEASNINFQKVEMASNHNIIKENPDPMSYYTHENPLLDELESLDLNNITPLDALMMLNQWQKKLKEISR